MSRAKVDDSDKLRQFTGSVMQKHMEILGGKIACGELARKLLTAAAEEKMKDGNN